MNVREASDVLQGSIPVVVQRVSLVEGRVSSELLMLCSFLRIRMNAGLPWQVADRVEAGRDAPGVICLVFLPQGGLPHLILVQSNATAENSCQTAQIVCGF